MSVILKRSMIGAGALILGACSTQDIGYKAPTETLILAEDDIARQQSGIPCPLEKGDCGNRNRPFALQQLNNAQLVELQANTDLNPALDPSGLVRDRSAGSGPN